MVLFILAMKEWRITIKTTHFQFTSSLISEKKQEFKFWWTTKDIFARVLFKVEIIFVCVCLCAIFVNSCLSLPMCLCVCFYRSGIVVKFLPHFSTMFIETVWFTCTRSSQIQFTWWLFAGSCLLFLMTGIISRLPFFFSHGWVLTIGT